MTELSNKITINTNVCDNAKDILFVLLEKGFDYRELAEMLWDEKEISKYFQIIGDSEKVASITKDLATEVFNHVSDSTMEEISLDCYF